MGIKSFIDYHKIYGEFYDGVLELARMEDMFSQPGREVADKDEIKYRHLVDDILSQCPPGTSIEDLIGLVVVGRRIGK